MTFPKTEGTWAAIKKGKANPVVTGYVEVFPTAKGRNVSIPGVSRFLDIGDDGEFVLLGSVR